MVTPAIIGPVAAIAAGATSAGGGLAASLPATIIPAIASAGLKAGAALAARPDGPPELSDDRKKSLGRFAELLAEENQIASESTKDGFIFGPNSRPIRFSPVKRQIERPLKFIGIG